MDLSKGQKISLVKGTDSISELRFGVNWGKIKKGGEKKLFGLLGTTATSETSVDLDAAAFCFDANNKCVADCYTNLLGGKLDIGFLKHSGDDLSGDSSRDDSDNETISAFISRIPENVNNIVFTVNSFSRQSFDEIPYVGIRIYEGAVNNPTNVRCRFNLENDYTFKGKKATIIGKLYRRPDGWNFEAIGDVLDVNGITNIRAAAARYI